MNAMQNLTTKEIDILKLVAQGYENKPIATEIFISVHTVKVYISSIIKKLNAKNRTNAVYLALKNNIID